MSKPPKSESDRHPEGLIVGDDGRLRCSWGASVPGFADYHDTEWGIPVADDHKLFEKLCLEGFQSGLSWRTILDKRPAFREVFLDFDFEQVARFGEADVERLVRDARIVRHRGKIEATVNNARRACEAVKTYGSLGALILALRTSARGSACPNHARCPDEYLQDRRLCQARGRPEEAGLAVLRPDDCLRVHAGDGAGQRPPGRLCRAG